MRDKANDPIRLQLILENINNIEEFTSGINSFEEFTANKILTHAVVYNLQCIGESVYKLSHEFTSSHLGMDWDAIKGLRNVLVHDYYAVNIGKVWAILQNDVPELKKYLQDIIIL